VSEPLAITLSPEAIEAIAHRAAEIVLERDTRDTNTSPWLSISAAASYVGLSEKTLERAIARGRLRSSTVGRRRLLHHEDLDAYVRAATGEE
jgi:excisionase family DNA binding protein